MRETGSSLRLRAPAKINLSLEVVGKRSDGFHDLVSIMQTVDLYDDVVVSPADSIAFSCGDESLEHDANLVVRAARLLRDRYSVRAGCNLRLHKRIPTAAGLGGASSDAAATLVGLNRLWSLDLGVDGLTALAAEIGSDVPFFLYGGTALVTGRGEKVDPLVPACRSWYALIKPEEAVATARVFAKLTGDSWTDGNLTRTLASRMGAKCTACIGRNSLQEALFALCPEAQACFEHVRSLAPHRTFISGSGPTVVAACETREECDLVAKGSEGRGWWTAVCASQDLAQA